MTSNLRFVLDTSVIISALLLPRSVPRQAFDLAFIQGTVLVSDTRLNELDDELPSLGTLIGERLTTVALPDENCIGEPFWTIMMIRDGENTGVWFALRLDSTDKKVFIPLFFSKYHAEIFLRQMDLDATTWGIRGLPRYVLRGLIVRLEASEIRHELFDMDSSGAVLMFLPPNTKQTDYFVPIPITREQLITEYYGESVPSIRNINNDPSSWTS